MSGQGATHHVESTYECFWLPFSTGMKEVFPRHDTILCMNEHCELANIVLPEMLIAAARAKAIYEQPNTDIAFVQRICRGKDDSYIVPLVYTREQVSRISRLHSCFAKGKLKRELKKGFWTSFVTQVRENSSSYLRQPSLLQPLRRAQVTGNEHAINPDALETIRGFENKVPVFIYTNPDSELKLDKEQLHRELLIRNMLAKECLKLIEDTVRSSPSGQQWRKDKAFMHTMSRVEAELQLNSEVVIAPMAKLLLDPDKAELILEPEVMLELTPEGEKAIQNIDEPSLKSCFCITDWGEPSTAQIVLHVGELENLMSPESATSPAITIIKDELGIHTLPAYLFTISTDIFGEDITSGEIRYLDEVPASEIPEIRWLPAAGNAPQVWWQTDVIAKKILWLVTYNLCSHQIGEPLDVTYAATPIGDNAIQVAVTEGNREEGTPYAFAVISDELEVNAIPIFPTGAMEHHSDGSMTVKQGLFLKNYTITRQGERRQTDELIRLLDRPMYSLIMSGKESSLTKYTD